MYFLPLYRSYIIKSPIQGPIRASLHCPFPVYWMNSHQKHFMKYTNDNLATWGNTDILVEYDVMFKVSGRNHLIEYVFYPLHRCFCLPHISDALIYMCDKLGSSGFVCSGRRTRADWVQRSVTISRMFLILDYFPSVRLPSIWNLKIRYNTPNRILSAIRNEIKY